MALGKDRAEKEKSGTGRGSPGGLANQAGPQGTQGSSQGAVSGSKLSPKTIKKVQFKGRRSPLTVKSPLTTNGATGNEQSPSQLALYNSLKKSGHLGSLSDPSSPKGTKRNSELNASDLRNVNENENNADGSGNGHKVTGITPMANNMGLNDNAGGSEADGSYAAKTAVIDKSRIRIYKLDDDGNPLEMSVAEHWIIASDLDGWFTEMVESGKLTREEGLFEFTTYAQHWRCGSMKAAKPEHVAKIIDLFDKHPGVMIDGKLVKLGGFTDEAMDWRNMHLHLDNGAIYRAKSPLEFLERKFNLFKDEINREDWMFKEIKHVPGSEIIVVLGMKPRLVRHVKTLGWKVPFVGGMKRCFPARSEASVRAANTIAEKDKQGNRQAAIEAARALAPERAHAARAGDQDLNMSNFPNLANNNRSAPIRPPPVAPGANPPRAADKRQHDREKEKKRLKKARYHENRKLKAANKRALAELHKGEMAGSSGAGEPKGGDGKDADNNEDSAMGDGVAEAAAIPDYSALSGDEVKALDMIPKELEQLQEKIKKDEGNQALINRYANLEERHKALKEKLYKKD